MADDYLKSFTDGEAILADDTNSNNQFLLNQISSQLNAFRIEINNLLAGNVLKAGVILAVPFASIPAGFLKCDGSSLLRTDYTELFEAIGTIYGFTDDYHFNLPDFQGKFLRGYGGTSASIGTLQESAAPNITGQVRNGISLSWSSSITSSGVFVNLSAYGAHADCGWNGSGSVGFNFDASRISDVYTNGINEIYPDNYAVNWIIKY